MTMAFALFAATTGAAVPVMAAPAVPVPQAPTTAWVMPDVRNMVLQQAVNAVFDVTGDVELDLRLVDRKNNQQVLNLTNWSVCAQSPRAGSEISQKTKRVVLAVKRFNQRGCS
ncbi:MAG: hypothetical protein U1C73_15140 [Dietzia sp.]|nr:hypothetical protein [Dietzia sp.]